MLPIRLLGRNARHNVLTNLCRQKTSAGETTPRGAVVLGGAAYDSISTVTAHPLNMNASNPGVTYTGLGGVGRNVAEKLSAQGIEVSLISVVADDEAGHYIMSGLRKLGIDTSGIRFLQTEGQRSARYTAIHATDGELIVSVADMEIFKQLGPADVRAPGLIAKISSSNVVVADANFPVDTLLELATVCRELKKPFFFEPTSDVKAGLAAPCVPLVDVIKPNLTELMSILGALQKLSGGQLSLPASYDRTAKALHGNIYDAARTVPASDVGELAAALWSLMRPELCAASCGKHVVCSLGSRGVVWASSAGVTHVPTATLSLPSLNTNGAGDVLMSGLVAHVSAGRGRGGMIDLDALKASTQLATQHILTQSQKLG